MTAKDFRDRARAALAGKWNKFALAALIFALLSGAVNGLPGVGQVVSLIVTGPLTFGMVLISLFVIRGADFDVSKLFDGFKDFARVFCLYLVNSIFVFLWSLLFVIPGIIKALAYAMSGYILADDPAISQADARKLSMKMMEGNKGRLFCLYLSFIGWIFLSMLAFCIPLFWVIPYMQTATAAFYEDVRASYAAKQPA